MFWAPVCGSWTPSLASSKIDRLGDLDLVAAGGAAGFLHGQLDAIDDGLRRRELAALLRELDRDVDGALAGVASGGPAGAGCCATGWCCAAAGATARGEREDGRGSEHPNLGELHALLLLMSDRPAAPERPSVGVARPPPGTDAEPPPTPFCSRHPPDGALPGRRWWRAMVRDGRRIRVRARAARR